MAGPDPDRYQDHAGTTVWQDHTSPKYGPQPITLWIDRSTPPLFIGNPSGPGAALPIGFVTTEW